MLIPRIVIVAYRPKPGRVAQLEAEVRDHHPLLWSEGLVTDRKAIVLRAENGVIIEIFEWASADAIESAHHNPRVQAMWARFAAVSDYVPLNSLPETAGIFAEFEEMSFDRTPIPEPAPEGREE